MKATINGITLEGMPQEILEFMRLRDEQQARKLVQPYINPYGSGNNPLDYNKITCQNPSEKVKAGYSAGLE